MSLKISQRKVTVLPANTVALRGGSRMIGGCGYLAEIQINTVGFELIAHNECNKTLTEQ